MMLLLEKYEIRTPSGRVSEKWSFLFPSLPNQKLNLFSISSNFKLDKQIKDYHPTPHLLLNLLHRLQIIIKEF